MELLCHTANSSPPSQQIPRHIMRCGQMLLVFIALLTLANSYPAGNEQKSKNSTLNVTTTTPVPENKPLKIIVEDKTPPTESVVVEFIYNSNGGNSIELEGTDKDKYNVESLPHKDPKGNLNKNDTEKLAPKVINTETKKQVNASPSDTNQKIADIYMKAQTALRPQEESPIVENWPKYFYAAFNPIYPFPEIPYAKQNQITDQKNMDSYTSYNKEKRMNVEGPSLNPLSIYEREFRLPAFD